MSRLPASIETSRLLLRLIQEADTEALNTAILASHAQLERWMEWAVRPQAMEDTRLFCRDSVKSWEAETALNLVMVEPSSGEIVGACGYPRIDWSVPRFEIGYWCRTDRTGRGLVSEAVWALAGHPFRRLAANRVELRIDDANRRSWRVAERLGFRREATLRNDSRFGDGSLRTTRIYGATALSELHPASEEVAG